MNKKRLELSCHHGNINHPNQLVYIKELIDHYFNTIDIYEIDFVMFKNEIISSHDYDIGMIQKGSPLEDWIKFIIIDYGKILWIDIKENLSIFCNKYPKFNVHHFFTKLNKVRDFYIKQKDIDILNKIWISCQEPELYNQIVKLNVYPNLNIIYDIPNIDSYIYQIILNVIGLTCIVNNSVYNQYIHYDLREYKIISIDQSFFYDIDELIQFINSLLLTEGTTIVIYNFPLNVLPIKIRGYNIIMQYDF
jgi:hypothetical protein